MNDGTDNDILWEYMDRLRWRLRRYPEEWTADVSREIRQHLEQMIADLQVAGYSEDNAVRIAQSKFGSPERVADRLIIERARRNWPRALVPLILFPAWYTVLPRSSISWGYLLFAAVIGLCYGVVTGYWPEEPRTRPQTDSDKIKEVVWTTIAIIGIAAFMIWMPRQETETILAYSGATYAAGIPAYFAAKRIRRRRCLNL